MKAMKAMKAKRVSVVAQGKHAKKQVFRGNKVHTRSGLWKTHLMKGRKPLVSPITTGDPKPWREPFGPARLVLHDCVLVSRHRRNPHQQRSVCVAGAAAAPFEQCQIWAQIVLSQMDRDCLSVRW